MNRQYLKIMLCLPSANLKFLIIGTHMFSKLLNPIFIIHMKDKPTSGKR